MGQGVGSSGGKKMSGGAFGTCVACSIIMSPAQLAMHALNECV